MKPIYAKPPVGSRAAFQVRQDQFNYLDTRWHYHAEYELAYIHYPAGKRLAGNSVSNFEGHDLVFYGPNLPHAWMHEESQDGLEQGPKYAVVIHFSEACLGDGFFSIPEMYQVQTVLDKSKRGLMVHGPSRERIIGWMHQMVGKTGAERVILLLQILEELANKSDYSLLSSAGYWENHNDHDAIRMGTIYEYIVQNFTQDIQLEQMAELAHISPSAFCRYFKVRTKKTLKEFINDLRTNYACQLLEENKLNITQISYEAGFNNISNFNRRFKEIKGITPQQYKGSIRGLHTNNLLSDAALQAL